MGDLIYKYVVKVFTTIEFYKNNKANPIRKVIKTDTLKCMLIGSVLFCSYQFTKGRTHYIKYIANIFKGSIFGLVYSFHFTS